MNEYIQDIIFELSFKFDLSDKEEKILEKAIRRTYNRGVEDSLACVPEEKKRIDRRQFGSDTENDIIRGFNDCRQQTIDNISKLLTNK